jgi:hypothetical protein
MLPWWTILAVAALLQSARSSVPSFERGAAHDSLVRALVIDSARFALDSENVTFGEAQTVLGKARLNEPQHHGDIAWVCYKIRVDTRLLYLRLESDGELGGPSHYVMGFELGSEPPKGVSGAACSATTHRFRSIATDNALYVGMPISDLLATMHTPVEHADGRYRFVYNQKVTIPGGTPYDITATLDVDTRRGHVTRLTAWYVAAS